MDSVENRILDEVTHWQELPEPPIDETLKPCPFCGGVVKLENNSGDGYYVECLGPDCVLDTTVVHPIKYKERLIEQWNKRA